MDNQRLVIYSLPICGGAIVTHLAILSELFDALLESRVHSTTPDLVFGSSGGSVSAYVAMAGDWQADGITRVIKDLDPEMFLRSWFPKEMNYIPTGLLGIFNGGLYDQGYGGEYMLNKYFTPLTVSRTEIWCGTVNDTYRKAEFFCNKKKEDAMIQNASFFESKEYFGALDLNYLGDKDQIIADISKIIIASSTIPLLFRGTDYNSNIYVDGGVMYPSPTTPFKAEIYKILTNTNQYQPKHQEVTIDCEGNIIQPKCGTKKRFCHYYICPRNIDSSGYLQKSNIPGMRHITQLLNTSLLEDRFSGVEIIRMLAGPAINNIKYVNFPKVNQTNLIDILKWIDCIAEHYSLIFYPLVDLSINMTNFTSCELTEKIERTRGEYGMKVCFLPF